MSSSDAARTARTPSDSHLRALPHDAVEARVLLAGRDNGGTVPMSVESVTRKAGTPLLAAYRVASRLRRWTNETRKRKRENDPSRLLSLPHDALERVLARFGPGDGSALLALMATCATLHRACLDALASRFERTGTLAPLWQIGAGAHRRLLCATTHSAIELALVVAHFVSRSQAHGFMPSSSYRRMHQSILLQHRRSRARIVPRLVVEHSGREDPAWPSLARPSEWTRVCGEALARNPFTRIDGWRRDVWITICPHDPSVSIACAAHAIGVFSGGTPLLVLRSPQDSSRVAAWWLPDGSIAVYARQFREHRFVFESV